MKYLGLLLVAGMAYATQSPPPNEIVRKSVEAIEADWKLAPNYSYVERDVESKRHGAPVVKSYEVRMIEGSQYNRLVAVNDVPLSPAETAEQERKLRDEIERRRHETKREHARRIAKYNKERDQDHAMLRNMVDAFEFRLATEENVNGHDCWVLDAVPKPGYQPKDNEGKVLQGMKGRLWVEKTQYQWVKITAEVVKPVTFYGLAKVGPGTRILLEQAPVAANTWMPTRLSVRVKASALGFINEDSVDDETYRDYNRTPELEARKQ